MSLVGPGCVKTLRACRPDCWRGDAGKGLTDRGGKFSSIEPCGALMTSSGHLHGLIWARQDAPQARMAAINPQTQKICITRFML